MNEPPSEASSPRGRPPKVHSQTLRRCDNPACTSLIQWREQRGRLPRFCSDRCRQQANADFAHLQDELRRLLLLEDEELTYRERRRINSQRVRAEWLLSAFPRSVSDP